MYEDALTNIFRGVYAEYGNEKGPRRNLLNPCCFWWVVEESNL